MKFVLVALSWYYAVTLADPTKDPSNYCLDALNHKKAPGPEAELHGEVRIFNSLSYDNNQKA